MNPLITHFEGAIDGAHLPAGQLHTTHLDRPILVRYDLQRVAQCVSRQTWRERPETMWRYRELLPLAPECEPVSLGEGHTPLLPCPALADLFGVQKVWIKDESHLPTGSFKSRGMAMAVTMARHFGLHRLALPSAGNAGGAAAAYAARAGMEAFVFMPDDTPIINQYEALLAGAHTFLVNGLINDCGKLVKQGRHEMGWFDLSTLKEPYRLEGKKTMGLELADQMDWRLPDVVLYPTGGGTGLIGMWKAFGELAALGWLDAPTLPRMVAVQSDGCDPIPRAFASGARFAEAPADPRTAASGLRVPVAVGDFLILDAVRQSQGTAIAAPEDSLGHWMHVAAAREGVAVCPETAACLAAMQLLGAQGWLQPHHRVVIFNTGAAQKYVECLQALPQTPQHLRLDAPPDWTEWSD